MEVTRTNFKKVFPVVVEAFKTCDFLSIDGEFTGLSTLRERRNSYDTIEEKYRKLRQGSQNFLLLQYGICCFTWNEAEKKYIAQPFSFYIFPRPYKRNMNDVFFTCQSSSLDFLANNKFNFNKVFYEGISYMAPWEEQNARDRMEHQLKYFDSLPVSRVAETPEKEKVFIPKNQRDFVQGVCDSVALFLRDESRDRMDIPPCNAFQRKLLYETLEEKHPLGLYLESAVDETTNTKFIRCVKITETAKSKLNEEKRKEEMAELDDVIGFTKVMKLMADTKKLVVGHNMILDVVLTLAQFFAKLPEDLQEFKSLVVSVFNKVIDTKLMAMTQPLREKTSSSTVAGLMGMIEVDALPKCNVELAADFDSSVGYHDAGYDAYCTGYCFLSMAKELFNGLKLPSERIDVNAEILQPFCNRINVMGIQDVSFLDLTRPDVVPSRDHVFYIKYPKGWREQDIDDLFSSICTLSKPIVWLSENSAFVTLSRPEKKDEVIRLFVEAHTYPGVFVKPYEKAVPTWHSPSYRKVSSSSIVPSKEANKRKSDDPDPMPVVEKRPRQKSESKEDMEDGELSSDDSSSSSEDEGEENGIVGTAGDGTTPPGTEPTSKKLFDEPEDW